MLRRRPRARHPQALTLRGPPVYPAGPFPEGTVSDGPPESGPIPHGNVPLFAILTLFPEALRPYLEAGIVGLAHRAGLVDLRLVDFRDFARDRHRTVDDRPFGGGPGMVLRPEPILECVEWLEACEGPFRKLLLCPAGRRFDQERAEELAREPRVLLLCGRYEGFDERIAELGDFEPLSIGDYVLAGGEIPALAVTEACVRLLPGALGDERSAGADSFRRAVCGSEAGTGAGSGARSGKMLDHPHYTRPRVYRGRSVPEVLLAGDHARIAEWRERMALEKTRKWRPDLLEVAADRSAEQKPANEHEARPPEAPSEAQNSSGSLESEASRTRPVPKKGRSDERGPER